jgi:hypothetical protein
MLEEVQCAGQANSGPLGTIEATLRPGYCCRMCKPKRWRRPSDRRETAAAALKSLNEVGCGDPQDRARHWRSFATMVKSDSQADCFSMILHLP